MSIIIFSNNDSTTIVGSITSASLSVNLASGTGAQFPQPNVSLGQYFIATFIDQATGTQREIVHVTQILGDVATIVRAQENTTARAWNVGDIFAHLHTAYSHIKNAFFISCFSICIVFTRHTGTHPFI